MNRFTDEITLMHRSSGSQLAGGETGMQRAKAVRPIGRRSLLVGGAACVISRTSHAASPTIAWISFNSEADNAFILAAALEGLAAHGLVPGDRIRWLPRFANNERDRLASLVAEVLAAGADIVVTHGTATRPVIQAVAGRRPVIYAFSGEPTAAGLADGLARPRGNATGVTFMAVELNEKRIELLGQVAPTTRKVALLSSPNHAGESAEVEVCRRTVSRLGIDLLYLPVDNADEVERAVERAEREAADAYVALPDGVTLASRATVSTAALRRRLPCISGWPQYARSGWLMSFGPNLRHSYQRVGYYVARVLAGAKPSELPIEQPSSFELVLNRRTAQAIGLDFPADILARADEVIE